MCRFPKYLSGWGFFFLFPGFFFYHFVAASLNIPLFLGGLFGPVSAILFVLFALNLPFHFGRIFRYSPFFLALFMVFFSYCVWWTIANYFILANEVFITSACFQVTEVLVLWFSLFFVGTYLPVRSLKLKQIFIYSAIIISIITLYFYLKTGQSTFIVGQIYHNSMTPSYQGFARSALVVFVFVIATNKSFNLRIIFSIIGLIVLFLLGARSELFAFLSIVLTFSLLFMTKFIKHPFLLTFASLLLLVFIFFSADKLSSSRQMQVLDLSHSTSWLARKSLEENALEFIIESPFRGNFVSHISDDGSRGNYAHNFLSAWLSFGLFGCLLYLMLIFCSFIASAYYFIIKGMRSPEWILSFSFTLMILLLVLVAKSVFWPLPALGWGLVVNAFMHQLLSTGQVEL